MLLLLLLLSRAYTLTCTAMRHTLSANINFQKQLRRMTSGWKSGPNGHDHGRAGAGSEAVDAVDERSPLISLNNRPAENNRSLAHRILLDRRRTPGMDSDRRSVRWLAHTFNVVKATLLSSKCFPAT